MFILRVAMTMQALAPVVKVSLCWIHVRAETVNQFWAALWHAQILRHLVFAKRDLAALKFFLAGNHKFLAAFA